MFSASSLISRKACADERGQATVEAAFALPVLTVLVLLLLQPGIVLYDRIVMQGAAADGCRMLATSSNPDGDVEEDYVKRRLSAVPQIDQFHVHSGACSWRIEFTGDESSEEVGVRISNELKPLPLLDFGMALTGLSNSQGNIPIEVECRSRVQPDWIAASEEGRNPAGWVGI